MTDEERRTKQASWRAAHHEELLMQHRVYNAAHSKERTASAVLYDALYPEGKRARNRKYAHTHLEGQRTRSKIYREKYPEKNKAYAAAWAAKHSADLIAWRNAHRAEAYARTKAWVAANPERKRLQNLKRLHQLRGRGIMDIGAFYAKCGDLEWRCQICGEELTKNAVTIDHIVPVSKGGTNEIANLQPLCQSCNCRKGNRMMEHITQSAPPVEDRTNTDRL